MNRKKRKRKKMAQVSEPMHPDFQKIYSQFMRQYCGSADKECSKGKDMYYAFLNAHGLDDTKPYGERELQLE